MMTLYGIPNCDTIKKAKKWLTDNEIPFTFHDFRKDGLEEAQLKDWCKQVGWETLLNTRGTTWRKLAQEQKKQISEASAIALMLESPALIKRPVAVAKQLTVVGFKVQQYEDSFQSP